MPKPRLAILMMVLTINTYYFQMENAQNALRPARELRDSNLLVYKKSRVAVSAGEVFPSIADENNYNYNG